ncbi:MAG: peptide deformylase [Flavobacteriaceae bacterium]|nr:peptide deformylase [Bacteroidia bacterium]MBT8287354.1 peptide deformylase [Bacteroidia bacterium]NNF75023.1 peptide deformylase [Flavobacteriaceae bacterium]NNK73744.1 peptide deformylase [Flavobacteriaceae bacterium]
MILPIVAYGDPVLRKKCKPIGKDFPKLDELISNMYESMYAADGIGLAAPQIGSPVRIFIVDASPFADDEDTFSEEERLYLKDFKKTFINARVIEESGDDWAFNEGCLSIPFIREDVFRQSKIKIEYQDENFNSHIEEFDGLVARIIQHEYDHIEGVLFTDKLSSLKKRLIKSKLTNISKGNIDINYKMRFPNLKKIKRR